MSTGSQNPLPDSGRLSDLNKAPMEADPEKGEFWCDECGSRCTKSQAGLRPGAEYGHRPGCVERPDEAFPGGEQR